MLTYKEVSRNVDWVLVWSLRFCISNILSGDTYSPHLPRNVSSGKSEDLYTLYKHCLPFIDLSIYLPLLHLHERQQKTVSINMEPWFGLLSVRSEACHHTKLHYHTLDLQGQEQGSPVNRWLTKSQPTCLPELVSSVTACLVSYE